MKFTWFISGFVLGLSVLSVSFASVPSRIKNDPAIYQELRELDVKKERGIDFDSDVRTLSQKEKAYRLQEKSELTALSDHPRLKSVIARIQKSSLSYRAGSKVSNKKRLN